jgi:hypothetical protein
MVLHQDRDDLDTFLDCRDQLRRHHQIRAVADHDKNIAVRTGKSYAEPAGDLVAHTGVAVLHVITLRVTGPPQLV